MIWQKTPTQSAVLDWLEPRSSAMLMLATSAGKTALALTQIDRWMADGADKALVVTPVKVVDQWATEAAKWDHLSWLADQVQLLRFQELGMVRGKDDLLEFSNKRQAKKDLQAKAARVHVCSWSMFAAVEEAYGKNWPYDIIVFDESDKLGSWTSETTKAARRVRAKQPRCRHVLMLAATPAANNRDKLFPQLEVLQPGVLGGTMTAFREQWCAPDKVDRQSGNVWSWKIAPSRADEFAKLVATLAVATEDPLGIEIRTCVRDLGALPDPACDWYTELKTTMCIKELDLLAPGQAQVRSKLRQLGTGFVYRGDDQGKKDVVAAHSKKWVDLTELATELGHRQALIAVEWQAEEDAVLHVLGAKAMSIDAKGARQAFDAGEVRFLVINVRQGHGLDGLQHRAYDVILPTVPQDLGLYIQVIGRLKRFGQKSPHVNVHLQVCGPEDRRCLNEVLPRKQLREVDPIYAACMLKVV